MTSRPDPTAERTRRLLAGWLVGGAVIAASGAFLALVFDRSGAGPLSAARADRRPPASNPPGMVWVPGGTFAMGADDLSDAVPVHEVEVSGFWMDETEVTNDQFARFVEETGYKTIAERPPDPKDFPGAPPENLVPGSIVLNPPDGPVDLDQPMSWWRYAPGASWKHPEGPASSIDGKGDHPVVHIAWDDAVAYAKWAGKRLPTEAEFEYAARGGLARKKYAWGDELTPGGRYPANIWQGEFPSRNTGDDGWLTTAPVKTFPPNGFGLYDIAGNVWEWCTDWYRPDTYEFSGSHDPRGPESSFDPGEPGTPKRVQRGGSFMCAENYCTRYLVASRGKGEPSSAAFHLGFRCVRRPGDRPNDALLK